MKQGFSDYTYNDNNQLTFEVIDSDTTIMYSYDDNGNLTFKTDGTDTTLYEWDWNNRLIGTTDDGGGTSYEYDGDGNRISKTVNSVKTKYINDVGLPLVQVLFETNDEDTVLAKYTYGNDLIAMDRAGENSYYHYDGLGSVRQMTDDTEAIVASYTYDSFGNLIASTGTSENSYGFTGEQQFREADGLVFLRARYYDSRLGRFISKDPIGYRGGVNLYVYCLNNSVKYTDPEGKVVIPIMGPSCVACAAMIGKDIGLLIGNCLVEASGAQCDRGKTFRDCIKRDIKHLLIPETKWETALKLAACDICLLGLLPDPIPVPDHIPDVIPVPMGN